MKKYFSLVVIFLLLFIFPQSDAFAHLAGQPPFFKIGGVYSGLYNVPTTSLVEFRLPQDSPPRLFTVGEDIDFEMEGATLPVPPEIVAVTTFGWDFGDLSEKGSGLKNTHRYTKPGSYFLEITAQTADLPQPQLIQSVIMHIVPTTGYKMAQAQIFVNGKTVKDPLLDDIKVAFGDEVTLDATQSIPGEGKIVDYIWDLGNGKSVKGEKVTVVYDENDYAFFPVLRLVDEHGLISDAFIQVTNSKIDLSSDAGNTLGLPGSVYKNLALIATGLLLGIGFIVGPFIYSYLKRKK